MEIKFGLIMWAFINDVMQVGGGGGQHFGETMYKSVSETAIVCCQMRLWGSTLNDVIYEWSFRLKNAKNQMVK